MTKHKKPCFLKFPEMAVDQSKDLEKFYNKTIKNGEFVCDSDVLAVKCYLAKKSLVDLDETVRGLVDVIIPILEDDIDVVRTTVNEWKRKIEELKSVLSKNIGE